MTRGRETEDPRMAPAQGGGTRALRRRREDALHGGRAVASSVPGERTEKTRNGRKWTGTDRMDMNRLRSGASRRDGSMADLLQPGQILAGFNTEMTGPPLWRCAFRIPPSLGGWGAVKRRRRSVEAAGVADSLADHTSYLFPGRINVCDPQEKGNHRNTARSQRTPTSSTPHRDSSSDTKRSTAHTPCSSSTTPRACAASPSTTSTPRTASRSSSPASRASSKSSSSASSSPCAPASPSRRPSGPSASRTPETTSASTSNAPRVTRTSSPTTPSAASSRPPRAGPAASTSSASTP